MGGRDLTGDGAPPPIRRRLTSYRGKAGVDVERVPVSAQAVQGRLEPNAGETGIVQIHDSLIVPEPFFPPYTHRRRIKLNYHEGSKKKNK